MRKIIIGLFLCMFCIALPACRKKEDGKVLAPAQEAWTQIRPEADDILNILHAYTLDSDGNVYLVFEKLGEQGTWLAEFNPAGEETLRLDLE